MQGTFSEDGISIDDVFDPDKCSIALLKILQNLSGKSEGEFPASYRWTDIIYDKITQQYGSKSSGHVNRFDPVSRRLDASTDGVRKRAFDSIGHSSAFGKINR